MIEIHPSGRLRALLAAAALLGGPPAAADIVHLKNGNRVEGEVSPGSRPGHIKVTLDRGLELEFPDKDVREVEKKKSPVKEFEEKWAALPDGDVDAVLLLAEWARERKLRSKEEQAYRRVLEMDPDDPIARKELGYAVFRNRWVKEADLRGKHGLIQFRGDWVTPEEKERRLREELKKEISDLLRSVDSDNRYIREYSIKKLLDYRDPRARWTALAFLADEREAVRVVAVQMLAAIPEGPEGGKTSGKPAAVAGRPTAGGAKTTATPGKNGDPSRAKPASGRPSEPPPGPAEEEVSKAILERMLVEESRSVRSSLAAAVRKLRPRHLFDLALAAVKTSENALHRDRAAEGLLFALRKAWVPELFQALAVRPPGVGPTVAGNPAVRDVLRQIFREDFEYRSADWEAWWARSGNRFSDE